MPLLWKSPQPGSLSMHTHLVTACFPYFPTTAEVGGCSSEAWPYWRDRHTTSPFLNCKIVCKIIYKTSSYFITNKHRCHPLFFIKGSSKFVTCKVHQVPQNRHSRVSWDTGQFLFPSLGPCSGTYHTLPFMLLYPSVQLITCHKKQTCQVSPRPL